MNCINEIAPYYTPAGAWVFDDASRGLLAEPFVCGVPEMIEDVLGVINRGENTFPKQAFRLQFSASPFPGFHRKLDRLREEHGGNWYVDTMSGKEGWLCPAFFKYFDTAPDSIYIRVLAP